MSAFTAINLGRSLIPFVLLPILTHALAPAEYGALSLFEATILVLSPLMLFNSQSFVGGRFYKVERDKVAAINLNAIVGCLILYTGFQLLFFLFEKPLRAGLGLTDSFVLWIPVFVFGRVLNTYVGTLWQVEHQVGTYGIFSIGTLVFDLLFSLWLVLGLSGGYQGRLIGSHLAFYLFAAAGMWQLRRTGLLQGQVSAERLREMFNYGAPLILHSIGGVSMALATRFVLARMLGKEAVAEYTVTYQVASVMLLAGTSINQAWSGFLFRLLGESGGASKRAVGRLMLLLVGVLAAGCAAIWMMRDLLFALFVDQRFATAKQYFGYLLLAFMFQSIYFLFVNFDFYDERVTSIGRTTLGTAIVNIALNLVLIPRFAVMGAAYATLITMALYMVLVVSRVVLFNRSFRQMWST
jgi:O-antigen/teichoic acid export membrane protein